ncbi:hypothetical protein EBU71_12635, partial [bacterium]|nr:hypothetical protein [Candidatus Elulimicrobium humile]
MPQDENFIKENINLKYNGKLDEENMHKNFHYSFVQNERNIQDLQKIGLEIEMSTPNFNIYRFQKIFIFISNQISTPSVSHGNSRLSGEWFITDIIYTFDSKRFVQKIKLIKRELELSPEEFETETQQSPPQQSGSNTSNNVDQVSTDTTNPNTTPGGDNLVGATSSVPLDDGNFPLTKEIFRKIYEGRVNNKVIELYYEPMKAAMINYKIDTKSRIAAFLSQVNAETGNLVYVSEIASGQDYEGRTDLGNNNPGDGRRFKGRGLIQLTGRNNYKKAGDFFNKDFVGNPTIVASDNETHKKGASTKEQIENSILTAVRYWLKGSSRGNLNDFADRLSIDKNLPESLSISSLPNKNADGKQYGNKNNKNIATELAPTDKNFLDFT